MKRLVLRGFTVVIAVGSAGIGFLPLALAATPRADAPITATITPSAEGWYQPNPSCGASVGCVSTGSLPAQPPAAVPTSPFPARTLQVGFSAGQETARSYLAISLADVSGTVSGASLSVPLDLAQADGSVSPDTAKLQVCLVSGVIKAVDGSIDKPPTTDCTTTAPVTYVAKPTPHLQADLAALVPGLASAAGLALLPDATKAAQTDSWRVVFSAHDRTDAAKTPPASLTVTVEPIPVVVATTTTQPPVVSLPNTTTPGLGGIAPAIGTGFAPPPAPVTAAAPLAPVTAPIIAQAFAPRTITVGYAYPVVWLLPLGFLILFPLAARALTSDLTPRAAAPAHVRES